MRARAGGCCRLPRTLEGTEVFDDFPADRRHFFAARVVRWREAAPVSALWALMSTHALKHTCTLSPLALISG
jgi:hypothetical protein